jgi:hypothetical protein
MPAAFELLPEPGQRLFVDPAGAPLDVDLWNAETWKKYGISVFSPGERDRLYYKILGDFNDDKDRKALFDAELALRFRHLKLCLTHAARFKRAIAGPPEVPTSSICGVTQPTLQRVPLIPDGSEWDFVFEPRFTWRKTEPVVEAMFGMGDGVVTRRSALGEFLPGSPNAARGAMFRKSLSAAHLTPCRHREMFDEPLLKAALAEELTK